MTDGWKQSRKMVSCGSRWRESTVLLMINMYYSAFRSHDLKYRKGTVIHMVTVYTTSRINDKHQTDIKQRGLLILETKTSHHNQIKIVKEIKITSRYGVFLYLCVVVSLTCPGVTRSELTHVPCPQSSWCDAWLQSSWRSEHLIPYQLAAHWHL